MNELQKLENRELLRRTSEIAARERHVTVELLHHIQEVDRRELFLEAGYPSLYEYVRKELKLSEGASYRRIQSMRLLNDVPGAARKIEEGDLSISTASKIQSATKNATPEEKSKLVDDLAGKSARETDRKLSQLDPKLSREYCRWLNSDEVQLTFSLTKEAFRRMEELQSLRTHKDIQKTFKVLFTDLIELGHEKWNPMQRNATSTSKLHCTKTNQVWKTVPPSLRRAVWKRDKGICTFQVEGTDRTCGSRDLVQIDHIEPLALGGKNELNNLRLLCAAHNRKRAEETFGERP